MLKNGLVKRLWLQTGPQIITTHMLPHITISKGNQTMKFGQLIEYNVRNIFLKSHAENEAGRLVPEIFWFLKKL